MKLDFVPLGKLVVGRTNMRHGRKAPDVSDILPTVRKRGVLQPILVRPLAAAPDDAPDAAAFEIVAGRRRFTAAAIVADERRAGGDPDPAADVIACAILDAGDDAAAIEASLIENLARLDADEVTQWETFTRLVREGRSAQDIAETFGLPDLAIRRVLALGNLLPRIRAMYAREEIDRATVRHLTLASKNQQRAWLALADDPAAWCPSGHQLKAWLFGGATIAVRHALFDVLESGLATIADLFGEDAYFVDAAAFWTAQDAAIEARRATYVEAGWADAVVVSPAEHFAAWEHERAGKRKGGRVYLDVRATGEVVVHEGYVGRREAARLARSETDAVAARPPRPEVTSAMQTYLDLHRHAATRAALTAHPNTALRLMVAHAIVGSPLWRLAPEPQLARSDAVRESVELCRGEGVFDERRRAVLSLLDFSPDAPTVTGGNTDERGVAALFQRLLALPDAAVLDVVAVVMGETLASGSAAVEAVGLEIGVAMPDWWSADDAFFDLLRDREVLGRIVAETAGETVAVANAGERTAAQKAIVRDALGGTNGRARCERWVPRWMAFPPAAYTARGGVGTVAAHARATAMLAANDRGDPDPGAPGAVASRSQSAAEPPAASIAALAA